MRVEGAKEEGVVRAAGALREIADRRLKRVKGGISILGPAPALLKKLKGRYRWQLLIKGRDPKTLNGFLRELKKGFHERRFKAVSLTIDMDPMTTV
jgi:primosomal protein N' (replication factor Y)